MVPEAVTTFTIPWEGTEKDLGNGISIMFMTIDFIAFGCAMFMASKIIQRTKKRLKSEHAGMSLEEIEEERMRQRMRYEEQHMAEEVKAQKKNNSRSRKKNTIEKTCYKGSQKSSSSQGAC